MSDTLSYPAFGAEPTSPPPPHERDLIARVRAGDERAFEELVAAHYSAMCSAAFALLRSRDAVEDIVQTVLRKLWVARGKWQPRGPIHAYLLLATRHEAISLGRRLRAERGLVGQILRDGEGHVLPGMSAVPAPIDDALIAAELRAAVETAAAKLPDRCRTIFLMRWTGGLRQTEIAAHLGISIKTVEMQITRALKTIRGRLAEAGFP